MSGPAYVQAFTQPSCRARVDLALCIDLITLCLKSASLICSSFALSSEECRLSCMLPDMPSLIKVAFIHNSIQMDDLGIGYHSWSIQRISHCISPSFHFWNMDIWSHSIWSYLQTHLCLWHRHVLNHNQLYVSYEVMRFPFKKMSELLLRYFCLKLLRHLTALNQGPCAWLHLVLLFFLISPSFISSHSWRFDVKLAVKSHISFIILFCWFCALSVHCNKSRQLKTKERTRKLAGIKNKWFWN